MRISVIVIFVCAFFMVGAFAQSTSIDSLELLTKNHKEDTSLVNLFIDLGKALQKKGDFEKAKTWCDKAIELSGRMKFPIGEATAYHLRGSIFFDTYDFDEAKKNFTKGLEIRTKIDDKKGLASSYFGLARMELNQNHYDSAEVYGKKSIEYSKLSGDSAMYVKALNMVGSANYRLGKYQNAIEWWTIQLKVAEAINDSISIALTYGNIGSVYADFNNIPEALKYQRIALEMRIHNKQIKETASTYLNIARCYNVIRQVDSALYYNRLALSISLQYNIRNVSGLAYNNISALCLKMEKYDSALYYNQRAMAEMIAIKDTLGIAQNYIFGGDVFAFTGKKTGNWQYYYTKAEESYLKTLELSNKIGSREWANKAYYKLSDLYGEWKKFEKAFRYLDQYIELNDSLKSITFTEQVAEMQTKYESEKKENEITKLNSEKLLDQEKIARQKTLNYSLIAIASLILISIILIVRNYKKKREVAKQIALLEKQNAIETMRGKIASDVHDDMGANLTRIGLYSQQLLQEKDLPEKERQLIEKISNQSKDVITGMKEIIWASNPANDNLKSMLGFMRQYIDRFFDGTEIRPVVNFPQNAGEVMLHPEVRRNLFLILKESLNNAVKYSGTDKIDIDFNNQDENFNFSIKDYGKGLDEKPKDDFSNGMTNMRRRAEQIQSVFKLVSAPGNGVQIFIEGRLY